MLLEGLILAVLHKFGMLDHESLAAALVLLREEGKVAEVPEPGRRLSMPQLAPALESLIDRGLVAVYEEMGSSQRKYVLTKAGEELAKRIKLEALDELAERYGSLQYIPLALVVALRYPQYFIG